MSIRAMAATRNARLDVSVKNLLGADKPLCVLQTRKVWTAKGFEIDFYDCLESISKVLSAPTLFLHRGTFRVRRTHSDLSAPSGGIHSAVPSEF